MQARHAFAPKELPQELGKIFGKSPQHFCSPVCARVRIQAPHVFVQNLTPQDLFSCMDWFYAGGTRKSDFQNVTAKDVPHQGLMIKMLDVLAQVKDKARRLPPKEIKHLYKATSQAGEGACCNWQNQWPGRELLCTTTTTMTELPISDSHRHPKIC